ncbi:nuclear transcription factor Y subunit B-1-like [Rutidosis leptorrhynchoides]|uniref:nuclear transcription factor Y subunit B-1-like n=1 Tax=Rutidosis leptorrhynchoides TaxID=125765 RepID=UPI003A98D788
MDMEDVKHDKRSPESPCTNNSNNDNSKEQDRFLPIANVGRIMKKVIPGNGKISKDAKETVQECVFEFISFVTGEASSDKCQRERRKTINGDDVIWAITTLGFDDYVEPLKLYLIKYRQVEGDKVNNNMPKQQQCFEQQHQHGLSNYTSVYSSPTTNILWQQHFDTVGDQTFTLPFSSNSIQTQLYHQQDSIDSIGQW